MYQFPYAEVLEETPAAARAQEREAMHYAIELLEAAEFAGAQSPAGIEALSFLRRLWTVLIEDLAKPENELPKALRADLISIGLFVLNEAERIRFGQSEDFRGLIEISQSLGDGLA